MLQCKSRQSVLETRLRCAGRTATNRAKNNSVRAILPSCRPRQLLRRSKPRATRPLCASRTGSPSIAFLALLVTGLEIVISHPRFYWGETGNSNMQPLFSLHIPASRDTVPTGYQRVMPDENGWSRYLHFEAAWVAVLTGLVYGIYGFWSGHFLRTLMPTPKERHWRAFWGVIAKYLRRAAREEDEFYSYNVTQKTAYLAVIFILFPMPSSGPGLRCPPRSTPHFPGLWMCWAEGNRRAPFIFSSPDFSCCFWSSM